MAKIKLTERDQASPGTASYEVAGIQIHFRGPSAPYVGVGLIGENGEERSVVYTKQDATDILAAINNSTSKNLRKLVLQKILANGGLNGTMGE